MELGLDDEYLSERVIEVWNKADCIDEGEEASLPPLEAQSTEPSPLTESPAPQIQAHASQRRRQRPTRVLVSALNGYGLDHLLRVIEVKVAFVLGSRPWAPAWADFSEEYESPPRFG